MNAKMKKNGNGNGVETLDEGGEGEAPSSVMRIRIAPPNLKTAHFKIVGTAPYVQHAFSQKARQEIMNDQSEERQGGKRKKREPRDFDAEYHSAYHKSTEGWFGIPAPAIRSGLVGACRLIPNYNMTQAKLSVFCLADGFDASDGTPLIKITKGKPHPCEHAVRLAMGKTSIAIRAMWDPGWEATVRVQYDGDQFGAADVLNLLARVGMQVGVGEGRPLSKSSTGMGWGLFQVTS